LPGLLKHHTCRWLMGGDVAPEEGVEGESEDGRRGRSLHHHLFGMLCPKRKEEREGIEAPPARTYVRTRHVWLC